MKPDNLRLGLAKPLIHLVDSLITLIDGLAQL